MAEAGGSRQVFYSKRRKRESLFSLKEEKQNVKQSQDIVKIHTIFNSVS